MLLLCARTGLDKQAASRLSLLLSGPVDWGRLVKLAREHWVTQLLYWHLRRVDPALVPPSIVAQLPDEFHANLKRNLVLTHELRRLLTLFEARGIEALHGDMTIVIITHRLSTIRNADIIYVLEDGRIIELGDWATLARKENGRLNELRQMQGVA